MREMGTALRRLHVLINDPSHPEYPHAIELCRALEAGELTDEQFFALLLSPLPEEMNA